MRRQRGCRDTKALRHRHRPAALLRRRCRAWGSRRCRQPRGVLGGRSIVSQLRPALLQQGLLRKRAAQPRRRAVSTQQLGRLQHVHQLGVCPVTAAAAPGLSLRGWMRLRVPANSAWASRRSRPCAGASRQRLRRWWCTQLRVVGVQEAQRRLRALPSGGRRSSEVLSLRTALADAPPGRQPPAA